MNEQPLSWNSFPNRFNPIIKRNFPLPNSTSLSRFTQNYDRIELPSIKSFKSFNTNNEFKEILQQKLINEEVFWITVKTNIYIHLGILETILTLI